MTLHVDRNGNRVRTSYNVDGNPVLERACDANGENEVTRSWEYDEIGNVKKAAAGGFCYAYEYRPDGKLMKKSASGRTLVSCTFYPDGSLKTLTDVSGETVFYRYDSLGNLERICSQDGTEIVRYSYTPGGKLKEIRHGNGMHTDYEYDTDGNIVRLTLKTGEGSAVSDFRYEYDLNGNRLIKEGSRILPGEDRLKEQIVRYRYDRMERLTEEWRNGEAVRYVYDKCGNRLEKQGVEERRQYCYNKKNQLLSVTGVGSTAENQTELKTDFRYDLQGNVLEEADAQGRTEYRYDAFNQQTAVHRKDGQVQENRYDGETLRAGIRENGRESGFLYYNGELLAESGPDDSVINRYILGYGIAAGWQKGKEGYHSYHLDEQNSTAYITDADQGIENNYQYDAFGVIQSGKETIYSRILYTGQQYDQAAGQYYLRARYYNPVVGRFLQEDVYRGDGLNLYAYCDNNPVVYYDPSGYIPETSPGFNVYGLYDQGSKKPYYIGITNDPIRRSDEHRASGRLTGDGELRILDSNVTYGEARGYEQFYIEHYDTKTGTVGEAISQNNRGNKINSYDHNNQTRDRDRQNYFEDAYRKKNNEKGAGEKVGGEKCLD